MYRKQSNSYTICIRTCRLCSGDMLDIGLQFQDSIRAFLCGGSGVHAADGMLSRTSAVCTDGLLDIILVLLFKY